MPILEKVPEEKKQQIQNSDGQKFLYNIQSILKVAETSTRDNYIAESRPPIEK